MNFESSGLYPGSLRSLWRLCRTSLPGQQRIIGRLRRLRYSPNPEAIVVLGNQKSGTSAIAHLLADRCGLSKTVDIPEVWPPIATQILQDENDLFTVAALNPKPFSRELIKEPYLTFMPRQVHSLFSRGKFVFVCRDPRDNIRSILDRLGVPGYLSHYAPAPGTLPEAWAPTFEPQIWNGGRPRGDYIGILAQRWLLAVEAFRTWPGSIELIRYEDFLGRKIAAIDDLASRLHLKPVYDISDRVDIQYQPKGNRDIAWEDFFGPRNLTTIESICGRIATQFGYELSSGERGAARR